MSITAISYIKHIRGATRVESWKFNRISEENIVNIIK